MTGPSGRDGPSRLTIQTATSHLGRPTRPWLVLQAAAVLQANPTGRDRPSGTPNQAAAVLQALPTGGGGRGSASSQQRSASGSEPAPTEHGREAAPKRRVHEPVRDGVTAGGGEAEQMNEVHS